jgi:hypothetical protein
MGKNASKILGKPAAKEWKQVDDRASGRVPPTPTPPPLSAWQTYAFEHFRFAASWVAPSVASPWCSGRDRRSTFPCASHVDGQRGTRDDLRWKYTTFRHETSMDKQLCSQMVWRAEVGHRFSEINCALPGNSYLLRVRDEG